MINMERKKLYHKSKRYLLQDRIVKVITDVLSWLILKHKKLKCLVLLNYLLLFKVLIAAAVCTKAGKSK